MRISRKGNQISFTGLSDNLKKPEKDESFDRNILNDELDVLLSDLMHARDIICKTNHEFVFNFVFNSVNYSRDKLPSLYSKLEKLLSSTQKDEKVANDYTSLIKFISEEFNAEKEEEGYNENFLKKINKTLKEVSRLRKNFN